MADHGNRIRRRRDAPERFEYGEAMEWIANFVDNELGNGGAPRARPNDREWRVQRAKTIETLNELRRKLDTVCVSANYGKAVGNSAEIAGAAASVAGAVMALGGLPSAEVVSNVGNLVYHSGTLVDGLSNVIESLVSANYLNDIENVLKRDKELSLPLLEWLDFSRELDENVEAIFGVSLASEKWNNVMKVFYEFTKLSSSVRGYEATMSRIRQGRYSVHIGTDVKLERLQKFFQLLSASPELAGRMRVALSVLSASTGALQVFRSGAELYRSIVGIPNAAVPTLRGGPNLEIPTGRSVSVFCFFQAISMAISVISLINAASIIKKGTSHYSDAIKQLTRSLSWELRRMEEL